MTRKPDPGRFAREVLGLELWPHQREVIASKKPFRAIAAARQTGKSTLLAAEAIRVAFTRPGSTSLLLSATADAAKRLAADVTDLLRRAGLLDAAVEEENKSRIVLHGGSKIISLPASERQIRGYTCDGVLVLDEAAFMDESLWRAAFYTVAAVRNPLVYLASTPWGPRDHFFRRMWEEGMAGSEDWASFHWPYTVSPLINRALMEREKERVDPITYQAEVLGEWPDLSESFLSADEVMGAVADFDMIPPEEARGATAVAGVDWGVRYDSSALVVVAPFDLGRLNPDVPQPVLVVTWLEEHPAGSTDYATFVRRIYATSTGRIDGPGPSGYRYRLIHAEMNGVGAMPSEELARLFGTRLAPAEAGRGVVGIATSQTYKQDAYGKIKLLLQQGRLVLPRHPGLMKQLTHLKATFTQGGRLTIEADSPAIHDDLADALMHAVAAALKQPKLFCAPEARFASLRRNQPEEVIQNARGTRLPIPLPLTAGSWRMPVVDKPAGY